MAAAASHPLKDHSLLTPPPSPVLSHCPGNALCLLCSNTSPALGTPHAFVFSDLVLPEGPSLNGTHHNGSVAFRASRASLITLVRGHLKSGASPVHLSLFYDTPESALPVLMLSPLRMDRRMNG